MNWLQYFVSDPTSWRKLPCLLLFLHGRDKTPDTLRVEDVWAAVLLFEYKMFGFETGVYSTDDASGLRTLIADVKDRAEVAKLTVDALIKFGAEIALVTYEGSEKMSALPAFETPIRLRWAKRERTVEKTLVLEKTLEATLAKMGRSTRQDLAKKRRRLEASMGCELVPDASAMVSEQDIEALSSNPDLKGEIAGFQLKRWSSINLPGGFLVGLRSATGQWISLIGGWRQGGTTVVQWQMNMGGNDRASIGNVMRSFFLENEVARGTKNVTFYAGTPHSIKNAFLQEEVTDLVVRRRSWRARCLLLVARIFAEPHTLTGPANFLARTLTSGELKWHKNRTLHAVVQPVSSSVPPGLK